MPPRVHRKWRNQLRKDDKRDLKLGYVHFEVIFKSTSQILNKRFELNNLKGDPT
jgi:hypothetical protein